MSLRTSLQRLTRRDADAPTIRERLAASVARLGTARARPRKPEPPPADHADDVEWASTEGRVLAASGIDHRDGTMSYCDADGTISRRPVASYVGFAVTQLHAKVRAEIGRQRIEANALSPEDHEAWEARVRRELRADAVFALAFRPNVAFEAEEARRNGVEVERSELASDVDAALIALEAEFREADIAHSLALGDLNAARGRYVEPSMPRELRVWRHDWIHNVIPRPGTVALEDGGFRTKPYGRKEVEKMRGVRCLRPTYGTGAEPKPDTKLQERVDAIVVAWDAWQAAIEAAEGALNLTVLHDARDDAEERRIAILEKVRQTPARSLAGLGIKARIAASVIGSDDVRAEGLTRYFADDAVGMPYDVVGDVLALTGGMEAAAAPVEQRPALPDPLTEPAHDLSTLTLRDLARLYEAWSGIYRHVLAAGAIPCFCRDDKRYTPAGEILDQEYDRSGAFLSAIADEVRSRQPQGDGDINERLGVLVRYELESNDHISDPALRADLTASWGT